MLPFQKSQEMLDSSWDLSVSVWANSSIASDADSIPFMSLLICGRCGELGASTVSQSVNSVVIPLVHTCDGLAESNIWGISIIPLQWWNLGYSEKYMPVHEKCLRFRILELLPTCAFIVHALIWMVGKRRKNSGLFRWFGYLNFGYSDI